MIGIGVERVTREEGLTAHDYEEFFVGFGTYPT